MHDAERAIAIEDYNRTGKQGSSNVKVPDGVNTVPVIQHEGTWYCSLFFATD
jgi:hypothetical protein